MNTSRRKYVILILRGKVKLFLSITRKDMYRNPYIVLYFSHELSLTVHDRRWANFPCWDTTVRWDCWWPTRRECLMVPFTGKRQQGQQVIPCLACTFLLSLLFSVPSDTECIHGRHVSTLQRGPSLSLSTHHRKETLLQSSSVSCHSSFFLESLRSLCGRKNLFSLF